MANNIEVEMEQTVCMWKGNTKRRFYNYLLVKSDILHKLKREIADLGKIKNLSEKLTY